jgi:hypothetical protein
LIPFLYIFPTIYIYINLYIFSFCPLTWERYIFFFFLKNQKQRNKSNNANNNVWWCRNFKCKLIQTYPPRISWPSSFTLFFLPNHS